jgi:filamentous hemagglutinin family protein
MLTAKAQIVQTMNLKNGSVLHGYLKSQKTNGNIVFYAEKAEIIVDGQKVKNISGKWPSTACPMNGKPMPRRTNS